MRFIGGMLRSCGSGRSPDLSLLALNSSSHIALILVADLPNCHNPQKVIKSQKKTLGQELGSPSSGDDLNNLCYEDFEHIG